LLQKPICGLSDHPARVWIIVLALIFAAEYCVMLALPFVFPEHVSWFAESAVDAVLLTLVVAPLLWATLVRPLQHIIRIRTRYLADLFSTIEAERRRIAYELHDGVGQSLTLLVSGLRTLHANPEKQDLAPRLLELQQVSQVALKDLRQLALGLRPSLLDDLGLAPAIEQVAANMVENHRPIELTVDVAEIAGRRLPDEVETAVFRIFQEAMNNVMKHADASRASVRIHLEDGRVVVRVSDDGRGFDPLTTRDQAPNSGHMGVISMRERATLLGGTFAIDSRFSGGTRITAVIPAGVNAR
jgi:signal transduction histidine kinase